MPFLRLLFSLVTATALTLVFAALMESRPIGWPTYLLWFAGWACIIFTYLQQQAKARN